MICQNCQYNQKSTTESWWCDDCCYLNTPNRANFSTYLEDSANTESHQLKNNKKLSQRIDFSKLYIMMKELIKKKKKENKKKNGIFRI